MSSSAKPRPRATFILSLYVFSLTILLGADLGEAFSSSLAMYTRTCTNTNSPANINTNANVHSQTKTTTNRHRYPHRNDLSHIRSESFSLLAMSSSLEDPEETEEATLMVPKEAFTSEADIANRANEMLSSNQNVELRSELENSFLQYALSIILGRALPDARDGLKPVHRRILFAMQQLKLNPTTSHRKCARVVGEVLGKYHPHGDMSVYDALVRMAQDFSTSYRLIDGHGNFGSVDADPAAAMRYTECRLTSLATEGLLDELDLETVDFAANFDGNEEEPTVLPSKLPLLLLNGSSGIAVGMATNIPPHNLREVVAACKALIEKERMGLVTNSDNDSGDSTKTGKGGGLSDDELFKIVPGPDFPTGATILGTSDARKLFTTGNGRVLQRAVTHLEQIASSSGAGGNKKNRNAIIVTELPFQVNKASLLEQIAHLVNDKKLDGISDLRDESDRDGIRIVLELKQRDANPQIVLANLYKKTKLQTAFSGNLLALMKPDSGSDPAGSNTKGNNANDDDSSSSLSSSSNVSSYALTPQRFTLREALDYFLDFRFETIRRKTNFQLGKVQARTHIVDGLLLALNRIDDVIELIRSMPDAASCRAALMKKAESAASSSGKIPLALGLSRVQADSVLRLQLGQMTRLSHDKLSEERNDLESRRKGFQQILDEDDAVYNLMVEEMDVLDRKYGHERKSKIIYDDDGEVEEMDLVKNSRSVIVVTRGGYIKRMELHTFESQRRGTRGKRGTFAGDSSSIDDEVLHCITCNDRDTLLMITQNGIAYGLRAYQVPTGSRTAKGTPLPSVLPINIGQLVTAVLPVTEFKGDEYLVLATKQGMIKKTPLDAFEKISGRGLKIASLMEVDKLQWCHKCTDSDSILIGSTRGMASRFEASNLRPTGRTSRGVKAMKLRDGDTIADMNVLGGKGVGAEKDKEEFVLCITEQGYGKRVLKNAFRATSRGAVGVIAIKFKKKVGEDEPDRVSCFCIVNEDDEILVITSKGVMVRQKVAQIPCQSRSATGVMVQKVNNSDRITSISLVPTRATS